MFERIMRAGAEGARQSGALGMVAGLDRAILCEGYHLVKVIKVALTPGKTMEVANKQYRHTFECSMEKSASASDKGGNS